MKIFKKILLVLLVLVLVSAGLLAWHGFFSKPDIQVQKLEAFVSAGLEFKGPYSKSGQFLSEVEQKLKSAGYTGKKTFGMYYDDPSVTPPEACRSFLGCILDPSDDKMIQSLREKGFRVDSVDMKNGLHALLPAKSGLSYMIGPMIVYPAMGKKAQEMNLKTDTYALEIYDTEKKQIIYFMPLQPGS